ncbi:MFS transporter [Paraflavitalea soli]|uniref:MFS transporter n=1 Tax=Paraflavitalea soli TaxID=2315862 RepID=A0A3B7MRB2_9BACT|nr:MFS transporter [Paraflavitalea soli]AXY76337.1 MFS transporter [Paraflavitalea soli]
MLLRIAHTYRASFTGLSRETWLLSSIILINRAGTMVVPFMSMYITQNMHRSVADAGIVITLFGIGSVLGSAAGGYLIDKVGFRPVQIIASITGGILFILFGMVQHFTTLCALTVGMSFVAESFRPANVAAIAAYSAPANLTRSYSLNRLAMNIGWAVGSSMAGILAAINYHLLFWVEGIAYILVGLLIIALLPRTRGGPVKTIQTTTPAKKKSPWKDPFLLRFLVLTTLYMTCFILMFRLVPVFWKEELHINESVIGLLLGLNGVIIALFEMVLVGHWERKQRHVYYIVAGVVATGVAYLCLTLPRLPALFIATASVLFLTFGEMMAMPFINTVVMQRADEQSRGKYAAAYALSWSVANITGPVGGALVVMQGGYTLLWGILAGLCLVCAFIFNRLRDQNISKESRSSVS